jgi:hypothetical protein
VTQFESDACGYAPCAPLQHGITLGRFIANHHASENQKRSLSSFRTKYLRKPVLYIFPGKPLAMPIRAESGSGFGCWAQFAVSHFAIYEK